MRAPVWLFLLVAITGLLLGLRGSLPVAFSRVAHTPVVLVAKLAWVGRARGLLVALGSGLVSGNTQDGAGQPAACRGLCPRHA